MIRQLRPNITHELQCYGGRVLLKTVAATVHLREPQVGSCILNNLSKRGKGIAGKLNLSKE